jgi:hypothetical protein
MKNGCFDLRMAPDVCFLFSMLPEAGGWHRRRLDLKPYRRSAAPV